LQLVCWDRTGGADRIASIIIAMLNMHVARFNVPPSALLPAPHSHMNQQAQYKDSGTQFYLDALHQILSVRQRKKVKSFRPRRKCHMAARVPEEVNRTVVISALLNLSPDG
jgi:hypothetical protein